MKKQESKIGLLLAIVIILFSGCEKDTDKQSGFTDLSEIAIRYKWTYYEETDKTVITAGFEAHTPGGEGTEIQGPYTITFNGDTFGFGFAGVITVPGLADSGTIVYTDSTGTSYSAEVRPKQVRQIPDTFTSVNRNIESFFYWEGDSTGHDEYLGIMFCNIDSHHCHGNSTVPYSDRIFLHPDQLSMLAPGTNNTEASLRLDYSYELPTAAPKGGYMEQRVIGEKKIISVY